MPNTAVAKVKERPYTKVFELGRKNTGPRSRGSVVLARERWARSLFVLFNNLHTK